MSIVVCSFVFLLPILAAIIYNNSQKKKVKANMKVVYYKFFVFCTILFLSSQISIKLTSKESTYAGIIFIGNILMALLVFEFFLIPNQETHPDDIAIIHTSVLWLVGFLFVLLCCFGHFMDIAVPENEWNLHPIYDIRKISTKVYSELAMPSNDVENLPICNLFSYVKKTGDSVSAESLDDLPPLVDASGRKAEDVFDWADISGINKYPHLNKPVASPAQQWPSQQLPNNNTTV